MRRYCVLPVIAMNLAISTASGGTFGFEEDTTVGGYGVIEYQRSPSGHGFWCFSPGLELQWGP